MTAFTKHPRETERLEAVKSYQLLEGVQENIFDEITRMAAKLFRVPHALITILEADRQWFKSSYGFGKISGTPRGLAFCSEAILRDGVMVVEDTTLSECFKQHPMVLGEPHIRFYAGAPLISSDGLPLGALCIVDTKPRSFSEDDKELLQTLARQAMAQMSLKKLDHEIRVRTHAIDQAPVAMFFVDRIVETRPILYANPAFSEMTGYSTSETRGMSIFTLRGPDTCEKTVLEIRRALLNARAHRATLKGYRKNGSYFWADATISPVIEPDGSCRYYYVVMDDVTEKKNREALILSHQQNLIESQKMAALGRMAVGIAHEINNPLSIIRGRSEILLLETLSGAVLSPVKVQESTQNIMRTVDRIVKIVRGLRGISRSSEADPFVSTPASEIVSDAVEFCRERCQRKGVELHVPHIPPGNQIYCRPEQIVQVLLNLISNAADQVEKSVESGKIQESWIRLEYIETSDSVEIAVVDSGTGICPEIRGRLFEPFSTTKEIGKGVGLGLFISKDIAEAHSGCLRVDAESPNTRFVLTLPRFSN